jgi:hypothetical protein
VRYTPLEFVFPRWLAVLAPDFIERCREAGYSITFYGED